MLNIFNKKKKEEGNNGLAWDDQATQALDQSMDQTPVPAAMKGTVRKKLAKAAEEQAVKSGHTSVTAEDLMQGLLSQLPENMRHKVEEAAKQGPEGMKNLEEDLKNE